MKEYDEYVFSGNLAEVCEQFIAEKRSMGYTYNSEAKKLSEFSRMTEKFDFPQNTLTQEIVEAWIEKRPNESKRNRYSRFSLIKQFGEYMNRLGYSAYMIPETEYPKNNGFGEYIPYIFTHDEICDFFNAADNMPEKSHSISPRRRFMFPQIFRIMYCCGLRVSEVVALKSTDVDLDNGILTILDSKFHKSRYIPMSAELTKSLRKYSENNTHEPYFFPSPKGGCYDVRSIYNAFRELLWCAGISHRGRGKGPRLHDFRHTFAVHSLEKISKSNIPLSSALPRLSAYLGHENLSVTEKYLRMTAEIYPDISALLSDKYGYIIPKGGATQ